MKTRYWSPVALIALSVAYTPILLSVPGGLEGVFGVGVWACPVIYIAATGWLAWAISAPRGEPLALRRRWLGMLALAALPFGAIVYLIATTRDVMVMALPFVVLPLLIPLAFCAWGARRLFRLGKA